jgi:hypothetical protein
LSGENSDAKTAFESLSSHGFSCFEIAIFSFGAVLPIIQCIPTLTKKSLEKLNAAMEIVSMKLLADFEKNWGPET